MNNNLLKYYRQFKEIQLIILILLTGVFFSLFFYNPTLRSNILTSTSLLLVFGMAWIILLFSFFCLLYDFRKMELYIQQEHELKREAFIDNLTGIPNRHGFDTVFKTYQSGKDISKLGCALLSIDNLESINLNDGHETGDLIIKDICHLLENVGDEFGFVGRNGGNEFLTIFENCSKELMEKFYSNILSELAELNSSKPEFPDIKISFFYLLNSEVKAKRICDLVTLTYKKADI